MINLADALKGEPPRFVEPKKRVTIQGLRQLTVWGATAGAALLIAVLASRSDAGMQRIAVALHRPPAQGGAPVFDAQAETQRLAQAVRGLAANDDEIKTRLAAVERDMTDVTGAITKQIETADATRREVDGPSLAATAALTASVAPPAPASPVTTKPAAPALSPELPAATSHTQYGVDIGSGLTIEALRIRWATIRAAHPQLLQGLEPIISVKEARGDHVELRLVAGPFPQAGAAAQLCAALTEAGLFCQPTMFDGQHLSTAMNIPASGPAPMPGKPKRPEKPPEPAHSFWPRLQLQ